MAYGISEYPSTNTYDSDLQEMIELYRKMSKNYDTFLETVADLENKWDQLDGKIDAAVAKGVEDATREIIKEVEGIVAELQKNVSDQLDTNNAKISDLEKFVKETANALNTRMEALNKAVDELHKELDAALETVDSKIADEIAKYDEDIKRRIDSMTNGLWEEIYKLNEKLENITEEYPPVENPITGLMQPINEVLQEMWYWMRIFGITALEYDSLGLTAKEYDDLGITAAEYDYFAKSYLLDNLKDKILNPVTGKESTVQSSIYDVDRNTAIYSYDVEFFDALDYTAADLDAQALTAYELDYYGAGFLANSGLHNIAFKIAPHTYQFIKAIPITIVSSELVDLPNNMAVTFIADDATEKLAEFEKVLSWSSVLCGNGIGTDLPMLIDENMIHPLGFTSSDTFVQYLKSKIGEDADGSYIITIKIVFVQ